VNHPTTRGHDSAPRRSLGRFFDGEVVSVWLGGGGDGDVHSEFFELAHEPAGLLIG
jgi:hypothetical protein